MLWKRLSEIPDKEIPQGITKFKNENLKELGLEACCFGCPFCEVFLNTNFCPLGDCRSNATPCYSTPFRRYEQEHAKGAKHNQELAKKFYDYLNEKYKEAKK